MSRATSQLFSTRAGGEASQPSKEYTHQSLTEEILKTTDARLALAREPGSQRAPCGPRRGVTDHTKNILAFGERFFGGVYYERRKVA